MRNSTYGWIIAGVICLILITLAVTGLVNFTGGTATPTNPASSSSQALVTYFDSGVKTLSNTFANVPLRMVA